MRFAVVVIALLLCVSVPDAAAQTVSITPSVVELKGRHGQSVTYPLTVVNKSSLALTFDMQAQDVVVSRGKRLFFTAGDLDHSIAATAVFSPASLTVPPGESRKVMMTVTVPQAAATRAMIALFKGTTKIAMQGAASTVSLGTLLTFTLSEQQSLAASDLFVTPQSNTQNANFAITLTNDGPEPATPRGVAVILNDRRAIVGKASFDAVRVLPGERLTVKADYFGELDRGNYQVVSTFEFAGKAVTRTANLVVQ